MSQSAPHTLTTAGAAPPRRAARRGFTLIELMIAVVILSILAAVAVTSFRRYMARARSQEAAAFLLQIKLKQETYFTTYGQYTTTEPDGNYYPPGAPPPARPMKWEGECVAASGTLLHWCTLGALPPVGECFGGAGSAGEVCTYHQYQTEGWYPGGPLPPSDTIQKPDRPWWYARARGDTDGDANFSNWYFSSELSAPENRPPSGGAVAYY